LRFETPLALLLLVALPVFAWLGWPPRGRSKREILSLILRLIIAACLILSLAGLDLVSRVNDLAVVFLVDGSDSVLPEARAAEQAYVRQALAGMGPDDQAAVVVFGADALVERPMSPGRELGEITSTPLSGQTDLAGAIRLGMALYPPAAARRMVLISDGAATRGDGLAAARVAAESGIQVDTVAVGTTPAVEALVTGVDAPKYLQQGEVFDLKIEVQASRAMKAALRVLADGSLIYSTEKNLTAGSQAFSLPITAGKTGFSRFQVQIDPVQDTFSQNNSLSTFVQVAGPPRVLLVAPKAGEPVGLDSQPRPEEAASLAQALKAASFSVEQALPSGLPSELVGLAPYAALVMVDVPARELSSVQMQAVQSYVRDLGGGLVCVGGPTSYGVGGYYQTPLEETLPVEMQIKDEKRRPTLAIVFIIDHSGSMEESSGGVAKVELAKEAAIRSLELLFPTDRVGVIAFDDSASWVVPMTDLSNPAAVKSRIGTIRGGGGTDILAGVQAMAKVLPSDPASVKHVILLTDGGADPTGIPELVKKLHDENGITLTTVGVGQDAAIYLQHLADLGGGRYHFTTDPASIPSIFTEETSLVTRSYIEEHAFYPLQASPSAVLSGIRTMPQLLGYVATTAKDTSQKILVSDLGDPVLASWQYGLGRAVAFTSDATGRWARDWQAWEQFAAFWAQTVRSSIRDRAPSSLEVSVQNLGGAAQITLDAQSQAGAYLDGYQAQVRLIGPGGAAQAIDLQQVAPGEYTGQFQAAQPGSYMLNVTATPAEGSAGQALSEIAGWNLGYSDEYRLQSADPNLLEQIAAAGGGSLLSLADSAAQVFTHDLRSAWASHPAWTWLLLAAALLLPLDIAARRLYISRSELKRGWGTLLARAGLGAKAAPLPRERSERLGGLFEAKERARQEPAQDEPVMPPQAAPIPPQEPQIVEPPQAYTQAGTSEHDQNTAQEPVSTAASLLAAKRGRRRNE
jgi:Mg-chelatase subunit ChlD